jgi:endogenous inhibitor of DNA gyrase (YacG/DUF329 family)
MCGLVGIAGEILRPQVNAFNVLMLNNTMRGIDGCGVLKVEKLGKKYYFDVYKDETPSSLAVFSKEFNDFTKGFTSTLLMGHSRAATIGSVEEKNNHPFRREHIIGMHNGTIRGVFDYTKDFETDSEALFENIREKGLKKTLGHVHSKCYKPAYALTFYDNEKGDVYLFRNEERPLFIASNKKTVIWSSERALINFAIRRQGLDKDHKYELQSLKPGSLAKIEVLSNKPNLKLIPNYFDITRKPDYQSYYSKPTNTYYNKNKDKDKHKNQNQKQSQRKFFKPDEDKKDYNYTATIGSRWYNLKYLLDEVLTKGCCACGKPVNEINEVRFNPLDSKEFCCEDCKDILKQFGYDWEEWLIPEVAKI